MASLLHFHLLISCVWSKLPSKMNIFWLASFLYLIKLIFPCKECLSQLARYSIVMLWYFLKKKQERPYNRDKLIVSVCDFPWLPFHQNLVTPRKSIFNFLVLADYIVLLIYLLGWKWQDKMKSGTFITANQWKTETTFTSNITFFKTLICLQISIF